MVDTRCVEAHTVLPSERSLFIMAKKKRYGKEFKRQAAELVVKIGR